MEPEGRNEGLLSASAASKELELWAARASAAVLRIPSCIAISADFQVVRADGARLACTRSNTHVQSVSSP